MVANNLEVTSVELNVSSLSNTSFNLTSVPPPYTAFVHLNGSRIVIAARVPTGNTSVIVSVRALLSVSTAEAHSAAVPLGVGLVAAMIATSNDCHM